jgi:FixJ family two-component response regulator
VSSVTPTVFIVDDDVSVREALQSLVASAGWRPEACASAQEFLDRPRPAAPGCLILEVSLPDLTGLELQRRLATEGMAMPIIFITGYGDIPTTVQAMI